MHLQRQIAFDLINSKTMTVDFHDMKNHAWAALSCTFLFVMTKMHATVEDNTHVNEHI